MFPTQDSLLNLDPDCLSLVIERVLFGPPPPHRLAEHQRALLDLFAREYADSKFTFGDGRIIIAPGLTSFEALLCSSPSYFLALIAASSLNLRLSPETARHAAWVCTHRRQQLQDVLAIFSHHKYHAFSENPFFGLHVSCDASTLPALAPFFPFIRTLKIDTSFHHPGATGHLSIYPTLHLTTALAAGPSLPSLVSLDLHGLDLCTNPLSALEDALPALAPLCPALESIALSRHVPSAAIQGIADHDLLAVFARHPFPALRHLTLEGLSALHAVAPLAASPLLRMCAPQLTSLRLDDYFITDAAALASMRLTALDLSQHMAFPTRYPLRALPKATTLERLHIGGEDITGGALAPVLWELKNLQELAIVRAPMLTTDGLAPLPSLTALTRVSLTDCRRLSKTGAASHLMGADEITIEILRRVPNLREVQLGSPAAYLLRCIRQNKSSPAPLPFPVPQLSFDDIVTAPLFHPGPDPIYPPPSKLSASPSPNSFQIFRTRAICSLAQTKKIARIDLRGVRGFHPSTPAFLFASAPSLEELVLDSGVFHRRQVEQGLGLPPVSPGFNPHDHVEVIEGAVDEGALEALVAMDVLLEDEMDAAWNMDEAQWM